MAHDTEALDRIAEKALAAYCEATGLDDFSVGQWAEALEKDDEVGSVKAWRPAAIAAIAEFMNNFSLHDYLVWEAEYTTIAAKVSHFDKSPKDWLAFNKAEAFIYGMTPRKAVELHFCDEADFLDETSNS